MTDERIFTTSRSMSPSSPAEGASSSAWSGEEGRATVRSDQFTIEIQATVLGGRDTLAQAESGAACVRRGARGDEGRAARETRGPEAELTCEANASPYGSDIAAIRIAARVGGGPTSLVVSERARRCVACARAWVVTATARRRDPMTGGRDACAW